jgi:hypothetical protein
VLNCAADVHIPRSRSGLRWLFTQPQTYDVIVGVGASVIGVLSTLSYVGQQRYRSALAFGIATAAVLIASFAKHALGLAQARKKESTHELEGCLHTLYAVLDPGSGHPPATLRLAIHVPVDDMLEQVTEYVGVPPKAGRRGRRYSANAGIIGKAYRENSVFVGRRANDDYEEYVNELIREWNYTSAQARHLNPGVMEWMAVPLFDSDKQRVAAVVYLDATKREFFTAARQELVLSAVNGIAVFVGKRYA